MLCIIIIIVDNTDIKITVIIIIICCFNAALILIISTEPQCVVAFCCRFCLYCVFERARARACYTSHGHFIMSLS